MGERLNWKILQGTSDSLPGPTTFQAAFERWAAAITADGAIAATDSVHDLDMALRFSSCHRWIMLCGGLCWRSLHDAVFDNVVCCAAAVLSGYGMGRGRLCQSCHFLQAAAALHVALATSPLFTETADELKAMHPFELPQVGSRLLKNPIGHSRILGSAPFGGFIWTPLY